MASLPAGFERQTAWRGREPHSRIDTPRLSAENPFDPDQYKLRNTAERCVNKLKTYPAVATRYDKREYMYQGTIDVVSNPDLATRPGQ